MDAPASASRANTRRGNWRFPAFALAAGSLDALLLIGWRQIDPTNLAWIGKDPAQYQAGWEFLRRQPWTFPPTWLAHLDYPFGISAAYLDVIPIVAVPLHLFAGVLPVNFQYLGLWAVLCLILQTYFALKLLSRFISDSLVLCLGALFFLNAPILLNRLYGHFSLCSQWLILAALYYYFRPVERSGIARYMAPFAVLAILAGGITPYITVMVVLIALAAVLRSQLDATACSAPGGKPTTDGWFRNLSESRILWIALPAAAALLAFLVFGFVGMDSGPSMEAPGYGTFSLNLLSPFSPLHGSLLFKSIQLIPAQANEGYAYLGLGTMVLGIVSLAIRPSLLKKFATPSLRPLVFLSVVLTLLALSIRITLGPRTVAVVPVPVSIFHLLAIFRASARFFWPVYYLLMLAVLIGAALVIRNRGMKTALIAGCLLLQYADTAGLADDLARETRKVVFDPLVSADWAVLARANAHLVLVPAFQCDRAWTPGGDPDWHWFAWLAARSDMSLNSVYAARTSQQSDRFNCIILPQRLAHGIVMPGTVYVLGNGLARLAAASNPALHCGRIDGFDVCALNVAGSSAAVVRDRVVTNPGVFKDTKTR
ncbi:MAG: DUF6311 domain-containing protein [Rhizomicrobium sp.]